MSVKTYEKNGIRYVEDTLPENHVVVDNYTPTSSITPWDYHGGKHQREYKKVLQAAGLNPVSLEIRKTIVNPVGSGSGGSVRFGDNMLPHNYLLAVPVGEESAAINAIEKHKKALKDWIEGKCDLPEVCL